MKLQAEYIFRIRAPFVKAFHVRVAEPIDRTRAKRCLERSRSFQTFKKAYHEKWPLVTVDEKGDTGMNSEVGSTVVK